MNFEMQQLQKKFTIYQFIVSKLNISKNAGKFPCETSGIKCFLSETEQLEDVSL